MKIRELPIGAKIRERESGVDLMVCAKGHPGYGGVTLITDCVVCQACFDAPEKGRDGDMDILGESYYPRSNLGRWLNSEERDWYSPAHPLDAPPSEEALAARRSYYDCRAYNAYDKKPGFLAWFSPEFREALLPSRVECVNEAMDGAETLEARAFLPSGTELGLDMPDTIPEGSLFEGMREFRNRFAVPSKSALISAQWRPAYFDEEHFFWYWLRTPCPEKRGFVGYVHTVNPYSYKFACWPGMGVRPVMNVDGEAGVRPSAALPGRWLI